MPFLDVPDLDAIALRLRVWDAEHHLSEFMTSLLADASLHTVLVPLACSIAASVGGVAAAVHHGFDGVRFAGVIGSWPAAADLPVAAAPWTEVVTTDEPRWLVGTAEHDRLQHLAGAEHSNVG